MMKGGRGDALHVAVVPPQRMLPQKGGTAQPAAAVREREEGGGKKAVGVGQDTGEVALLPPTQAKRGERRNRVR